MLIKPKKDISRFISSEHILEPKCGIPKSLEKWYLNQIQIHNIFQKVTTKLGTYAKKTRLAIFSVILIHLLMFLLLDRPKYFELVIVKPKKCKKHI